MHIVYGQNSPERLQTVAEQADALGVAGRDDLQHLRQLEHERGEHNAVAEALAEHEGEAAAREERYDTTRIEAHTYVTSQKENPMARQATT